MRGEGELWVWTVCLFQSHVSDWQSDFEIRTFEEMLETTKRTAADFAVSLPINGNID